MIRLLVRRILKGNPVPSPQDHAKEHQDIVASRANDNLVRRTVYPSCLMQIAADRIAETILSFRITGTE